MFPLSDSDVIRRRRPYVNIVLIAICVAVFIYELFLGGLGQQLFFYRLGFIPRELAGSGALHTLNTSLGRFDITSPSPDWLTVFSAMFIHGGWLHLIGNMAFLWVFGDNIEDRFGHVKYLIFYLVAGVAASVLQIAIDPASDVPNIGASGAIAGVLGAYLVLFPRSRINTLVFFILITTIRIPAILLLGFWFLLQFMSGLGSLGASAQSTGVAYWAHVGGFVFGILVALIYRVATRRQIPPEPPLPEQYWRVRPM